MWARRRRDGSCFSGLSHGNHQGMLPSDQICDFSFLHLSGAARSGLTNTGKIKCVVFYHIFLNIFSGSPCLHCKPQLNHLLKQMAGHSTAKEEVYVSAHYGIQ